MENAQGTSEWCDDWIHKSQHTRIKERFRKFSVAEYRSRSAIDSIVAIYARFFQPLLTSWELIVGFSMSCKDEEFWKCIHYLLHPYAGAARVKQVRNAVKPSALIAPA